MAVWRHPTSWSKFKLALDCPKQLELTVSEVYTPDLGPDYYAAMGKTVQYVFEQYFMQGVNKTPAGRRVDVLQRVVGKVLASQWFQNLNITYVPGKDLKILEEEVRAQVENGFNQFLDLNLLDKKILSEQKWSATFQNFRMFGIMDFTYSIGTDVVEVFDGKGHAKKNADKRQILYYALILHASSKKIRRAGFLYWKHDFEEIDVSPRALKDFVEGDFQRGVEVMRKLQVGAENLKTNPSNENCFFCKWKSRCADSPFKKKEMELGGEKLVSFS